MCLYKLRTSGHDRGLDILVVARVRVRKSACDLGDVDQRACPDGLTMIVTVAALPALRSPNRHVTVPSSARHAPGGRANAAGRNLFPSHTDNGFQRFTTAGRSQTVSGSRWPRRSGVAVTLGQRHLPLVVGHGRRPRGV